MDRYLRQIAVANQAERLEGLLMALREEEIPFTLKRCRIGENWVENVHVEVGSGTPKVVIGAHHDSVDGSTGANDNASGVCVLLSLAKSWLQSPPGIPLELVFFDREERVDKGSEAYVRDTGKENILAMVNLDICGYGDTIAIAPSRNLQSGLLAGAIGGLDTVDYRFQIVDHLPPGDDVTFEKQGIPNISICILPAPEVEVVAKFAEHIYTNNPQGMEELPFVPSIMETMHNGPRDCVEVVDNQAMELLHAFMLDLIRKLKI